MTISRDHDSNRQSISRPRTPRALEGINLGLLLVGAVSLIANIAAIIELFGQRSSDLILVLAAVTVVAGVLLLIRLWHSPLGGATLAAVLLIAVGALLFGWTVGPAGTTSSIAVTIERNLNEGETVQWKREVIVRARGAKSGHSVWLLMRGTVTPIAFPQFCSNTQGDPELFKCQAQFGEEEGSKGSRFEVNIVVVDQGDHRTLTEHQGKGFDYKTPPVDYIAGLPKPIEVIRGS